MNVMEQVIALLEQGWHRGSLKRGNSYCAVGALYEVVDGSERLSREKYRVVDKLPEAQVLAKVIRTEMADKMEIPYSRIPSDIIAMFNDVQGTVEPVLEAMRYAAKEINDYPGE